MKAINKLFILLLIITTISSCKKDENNDDSNKLDTPELFTPSNGINVGQFSQIVTNNQNHVYVDFDWGDVENANEYKIEIATNQNFEASSIIRDQVTADSYIYFYLENPNPGNDVTFYWRVKAISPSFENSDYSQVFSFTATAEDNTVINPSPKNGTYNGYGSGPVFITSILDTTFTNLPIEITVQETSDGSGVFNVTYDFDVNGINVNPTVEGIESGSNIVITNQSYNLLGFVDLLINDNITFNSSNTTITGNAILDNVSGSSIVVDGNLSYSATK